MTMEKRNLQLEVRETSNDGILKVRGIVNTPGEKSQLLSSEGRRFYEIVAKGVFEKAIAKAKEILFLDSHDKNKILASTKNNSLTLSETEEGVVMEAEIVNTSYGRDAYELISSGLIGNMSFGFNCIKDSWTRDKDGILVRTLQEINLSEVSCVRVPAYEDSLINTRGLDVGVVDIPDLDEEKRDKGEPEKVNPDLFEFKNEDGETIGSIEIREHMAGIAGESADAELFIYNQIGNSMWEAWFGATIPTQIVSMIDRLRKCRNVDIRINSPGGSVFGGYAIANLIKTIPGNKTAYIDGICASISTVIALSCDKVVIPSNCIFMIHPPSNTISGTAKDFRKGAEILDKIEEGLLDIYMTNAKEGVTREKIKELVDEETYLTGIEAAEIFNMEVTGVNTEARDLPLVVPTQVSEFDLAIFEERDNEGENEPEDDNTSIEDEGKSEVGSEEPVNFNEEALRSLLQEIQEKRGNIK